MKVHIQLTQATKPAHAIVGILEDTLTPSAKRMDKALQGKITELLKQGIFTGKLGQTLPLFPVDGEYALILLVGCGKSTQLTPGNYRKIVFGAIKAASTTNSSQLASYLAELPVKDQSLSWKVKQMVEVTSDALYRFDLFKTEKEPATPLKELTILIDDANQLNTCQLAAKQGLAIAEGVTLTKNLANSPSNVCTPTFLAEQAKMLAKDYKSLSVDILHEAQMKKLGMGALLAVSQGSAEEAQLIVIHYQGSKKKEAPIVFVGKGVTFDTGGNSIKPADSMVGMKYDMCGAASVLGVIKAAAMLNMPLNIIGVIPAVENMPGGSSYKPEDILTSMSGQTIEVISTDAEGRLVLADALTYCERFNPDVIIDIATLTGAVVIALGLHTTALLSNYPPLAKALLTAGVESYDRAWELPLWDEYQEQIKSPFADIANLGGRSAGTITAACFLSRFSKKFHWAHLDIAGTAAIMSGAQERLATGRPVPLLMQYLLNRIGQA